jgi:CRP-like cAMP-binding protein
MPESVSDPVDLSPIGVLEELSDDDLRDLSGHGRTWRVEKGLEVIKQGDQQDCLYILLKGKLDVSREGDEGAIQLAELHGGDAFGEMNFLDREKASATVVAGGSATIWRMSRNDFYEFMDRHPKAAMKLFRALAVMVVGRLRHTLRECTGQSPAADPKKRWWF